jgi:hypothetical membrane protein
VYKISVSIDIIKEYDDLNMSLIKEIIGIIFGIILLLLLHIAAGILISFITLALVGIYGEHVFLLVIISSYSFFIWQFIYVIPLFLWLDEIDKFSIAKGVIIGAILTFFIYLVLMLTEQRHLIFWMFAR